eukprot:TRINITY_DN5901_c0_g1_i3.p4 TRINITY_DN5901_c0_g1~~TRINITY_DN5901_c0_g1_i3.p4  ORF type:complete len:110 (+),score=6.61 TRINITY_DN5901_c0_g1_i3:2498-2827(+)
MATIMHMTYMNVDHRQGSLAQCHFTTWGQGKWYGWVRVRASRFMTVLNLCQQCVSGDAVRALQSVAHTQILTSDTKRAGSHVAKSRAFEAAGDKDSQSCLLTDTSSTYF